MPLIVGIDYGLQSPAVCVYEGLTKKFSFDTCQHYSLSTFENITSPRKNIHLKTHKEFGSEIHRYNNISKWVMDILHKYDTTDIYMVGIEGYSMGSKGRIFNLAENTGILKLRLYDDAIPFDTVAPTSVKKFATGKGNGKKDVMFDQFKIDTGIDLKAELQPNRLLGSPTTDIIDAFYICKYFLFTK